MPCIEGVVKMKKLFNPILKHFGYQLNKKSKKKATPLSKEKQTKSKVKDPGYEEGPVVTARYKEGRWVLEDYEAAGNLIYEEKLGGYRNPNSSNPSVRWNPPKQRYNIFEND